jgi:hypothetical protein
MVDVFTLIIIQIDTNIYEYNTLFFYNNYVLNLKVIQLKFLMNGNISLRV